MSNTDGLEELRRLVAAFPEELPSLSARGGALIAAWQAERAQAAADRAALERAANDLMLSEESFVQMRAKRDDVLRELQTTQAALEIAQAKADVIGGEMCAEARAAGRGPCGACAWCVKKAEAERDAARLSVYELREQLRHSVSENALADAQNELAATRAALERALSDVEYWKREWAKDEMEIGSDANAILARAERDRAEAALERARHANDTERGEWSRLYALLSGSDNGTWSAADMERAIEAKLSALAQARAALSECRAALYGAREVIGNIGNIGHAIDLADAALSGGAR